MPLFLGSSILRAGYKGLLENILKTSPKTSRRKRGSQSLPAEVQVLESRKLLAADPINQVYSGLAGFGAEWDYSQGPYVAAPIAADVNADGKDDIIVVNGDKQVVAYDYSNGDLGATLTEIRTYSQTGTAVEIYSTPAVANVPGIGKVIFAGAADGRVFAWNAATGELLPGWPATVDIPVEGGAATDTANTIFGGISVADLDGDGVQEVLVTSANQRLTVFRMDGSLYWQFNNDAPIYTSPVVADVNRDGKMDVVLAGDSNFDPAYDFGGRVTLLSGDGHRIWVFQANQTFRSTPALFDLDQDGKLEIVAIASGNNWFGEPLPNTMYVLSSNGDIVRQESLSDFVGNGIYGSPAIGNIPGYLAEQTTAIIVDPENFNAIGNNSSTVQNPDQKFAANLDGDYVTSPILADVNEDGYLDTIVASRNVVRAYSGIDNNVLWEIILADRARVYSSVLVGYFDGSDTMQLVVINNAILDDTLRATGEINVYDIPGIQSKRVDWAMFRRDATGAVPLDRTADLAGFAAPGLFQLILGRQVERGEEGIVNQLRYAPSVSSFIDSLYATPEFRDNEIRRYYQVYLGREPDEAGLEFWREFIDSGNNLLTAQLFFAASDEAFQNAGNDAHAWVSNMYEAVLGRSASQADVDGWASRLNSGELRRSDIASGFVYSLENSQRVIGRLFSFLQEGGLSAPTADVLYATAWDLRRGKHYQEIVRDILETSAGFDRENGFVSYTDSDYLRVHAEGIFIRSLYQQLLLRTPSAEETIGWMQSMEAGMTFEQVASGFVRSTEYRVQIINQYYGMYLRTSATPTELNQWLSALEAGANREVIPLALMRGDAYWQQAGENASRFIFDAFFQTLGRRPTRDEVDEWLANENGREELPQFLLSSEEYFRRLIDFGALQFLRRLPNTPSDDSAFFNPSAPYGAQTQLDFLLAGGNSEELQIQGFASAEFRQLILTGALWTGTQWKLATEDAPE